MTGTAILGFAFVLVAIAAAFLMMHLWGYPFDEARQRSTAPRSLELLHRLLGYTFILLYLVIMSRMIPRLWMYQEELSSRSALHAFLGIAIGVVLLVKVAIIRLFPHFKKYLPIFGITLLCLTLASLAIPLALALREWHLSRQAHSPAARMLVQQRLSSLPGVSTTDVALFASPDGLAAGREAYLTHCNQCHDTRHILASLRPASEWHRTVSRMAEKSLTPGYRPIDAKETYSITAYLTAIRGIDAPAPETASSPSANPSSPSHSPMAPAQPTPTPSAQAPAPIPTATVDVAAVEALFAQHCIRCHSGARAPKGIVLESAATALASGAVTPGDIRGSLLLRAVRGETPTRMPFKSPPLSPQEIALLESWVASLASPSSTARPAAGVPLSPQSAPAANAPAPSPTLAARTPRPSPAPGEPLRYEHVEPIFAANCTSCHSPSGLMGPPPEGLMLGSYNDILHSPERPVLLPGNPAASLIVRHIRGIQSPRMPFNGPPWLSDQDTRLIEQWIRDGARDSAGNPAPIPVGEEVRLSGTLTARWVLDGAPFRVTSNTEIRDAAIGSHAELRATVASDGSLVAERLRGR